MSRFVLHTRCAIGGGRDDAPAGTQPPGGGRCVEAHEAVVADDDGPPDLSPALFGVPAGLAADVAKLAGASAVAMPSGATQIWTCPGSAGEAGSDEAPRCGDTPAAGGTLLTGDAATTALDNADTAYVGAAILPRADWRRDEDGAPLPSFDASWVKVTD